MAADHYPLTADHYDQVNRALISLNDAVQVINKAAATGMDTRAHSELVNHLQNQLNAIKAQFFPRGRPAG